MMAPAKRRKRDQLKVTIAPFKKAEDYKTCVDIQREVWGCSDLEIIPPAMLMAADHCGGLNLGAFNSLGEMVGFASSIVGNEKGEPIHHSYMLAVRKAYRNFDVGFKLKLAQRREALRQGIAKITWTFDPMQPMNAYFNFGKLAVWSNTHWEDFYGETTSFLDRGLPTDRFYACWELEAKRVEERLEDGPPRHDARKELKKYEVVNRLEPVAPGMAICSPLKLGAVSSPFLFEIPYNLPEIKNRNLGVALEWQGKLRQLFRTCFRKGFSATDFLLMEDEGRLRTFYLLEKPAGERKKK